MDKEINVNDTYSQNFSFTQDDVIIFSKATGDDNPIHLDSSLASKSIFGRPIIHGFLAGSIFSKIFGTLFPGQGTIYLKQSLSFKKPMYVETNYLATVKILDIFEVKCRASVDTKIFDQYGNETITGEALIQNDIFAS